MKLATIRSGRDGILALVDAGERVILPVPDIASTLQSALENWDEVEPLLRARAETIETTAGAQPYDVKSLDAPLPRAWQWLDGSTFASHGDLMSLAFNMEPLPTDVPLMYQGQSDLFYGPVAEIPFDSEDDQIDFEGEFGVIVSAVPRGVSVQDAAAYIRLVVIINDWSLRALAPDEMKRSFGFIHAKPASGMAPLAVTPDALGEYWRDSRVQLPLEVAVNGKHFGRAHGGAMSFGFDELVAHAARTRELVAGTVIGSGTVSNQNYRIVGSSCISERRMIEVIDDGAPSTPFLGFGDSVSMESHLPDGQSVFGRLEQRVAAG